MILSQKIQGLLFSIIPLTKVCLVLVTRGLSMHMVNILLLLIPMIGLSLIMLNI